MIPFILLVFFNSLDSSPTLNRKTISYNDSGSDGISNRNRRGEKKILQRDKFPIGDVSYSTKLGERATEKVIRKNVIQYFFPEFVLDSSRSLHHKSIGFVSDNRNDGKSVMVECNRYFFFHPILY